jgi:hypothetical protein
VSAADLTFDWRKVCIARKNRKRKKGPGKPGPYKRKTKNEKSGSLALLDDKLLAYSTAAAAVPR